MQVTFDCADVPAMVRFWSAVLGYEQEKPPPPFATWEEFAQVQGVPRDMWDAWGSAVDPAGEAPRLFFQRVPEGKTAKNRVHLDLRLSAREGSAGLAAEVDRVVGLGAQRLTEHDELGSHWVVLRDPEGNEFCIS
jgi:catechol 2,3-dioxygenase-like lactoylglutathione lyase family enzyme